MGKGKVVSISPPIAAGGPVWSVVYCKVETGDPTNAVVGNVYQYTATAAAAPPPLDLCGGTVAGSCITFQFAGNGVTSPLTVINPVVGGKC